MRGLLKSKPIADDEDVAEVIVNQSFERYLGANAGGVAHSYTDDRRNVIRFERASHPHSFYSKKVGQ